MKIFRSIEFEVLSSENFIIGDQIEVGKYTATCQKVTKKGALFLLDQYLDDAYQMNSKDMKESYEASELRKAINSEDVLDIFSEIRDKMVPFKNGDLIRIPYAEEMFGEIDIYEPSGKKQWELMKNHRNRVADRKGKTCEWGWLQNKSRFFESDFAGVGSNGISIFISALNSGGVRPVFRLKFNDYIRL